MSWGGGAEFVLVYTGKGKPPVVNYRQEKGAGVKWPSKPSLCTSKPCFAQWDRVPDSLPSHPASQSHQDAAASLAGQC